MRVFSAVLGISAVLLFRPDCRAEASGSVIDGAPDVGHGGQFVMAKPLVVPMRPDGVYRISGEVRADAVGMAVVGPNDLAEGKPHFYRMCPIAVSTNWTSFAFEVCVPEKDVETLRDGTSPLAVGWKKGDAISRLDYRGLTVVEEPPPKGVRATGWWEHSATNGFFNASFELGLVSHDVSANTAYVADARRPAVAIDDREAWHGGKSLRIDNRDFGRTVEFVSSAGPCDARQGNLTVSCFAKADRPVKATLRCRDILYDAVRGKMDFLGAVREVEIGTSWTQFELSTCNRNSMHGKASLFLSFDAPAVV